MPSTVKQVQEFFERITVLETRVADLMRWQKWQMVVLAGILIAVISKHF